MSAYIFRFHNFDCCILYYIGRPIRKYQTPLNKSIYAIGKTQITHAQAKLYNFLDKNGDINIEYNKNKNLLNISQNYKKTYIRIMNLSEPREVCIYICIHMYICVHICLYVSINMYTCMHLDKEMFTYICINYKRTYI
jgi:hypothetical protein